MTETVLPTSAADDNILDQMYRARKRLFVDRLGWKIPVDAEGREIDRFDALSPVYLVDTDGRGSHRGSVRLLPSTGETVLGKWIADTLDGVAVSSPSIWEFTRFCVIGRDEAPFTVADIEQVAVNLMLAICETCIAAKVDHVVGSFDRRVGDLYRRNGWLPDLLGSNGTGRNTVYLGIWETSENSAAALRAAGGVADPASLKSFFLR